MIRVQCPVATCRAENDSQALRCIHCNTPLQPYARVFFYSSQLFNRGLVAARKGQLRQARDLFAAVVQWCPKDREARNALAMACFALQDWSEARRQWKIVQDQAPHDHIARRGLALLAGRKAKRKARP